LCCESLVVAVAVLLALTGGTVVIKVASAKSLSQFTIPTSPEATIPGGSGPWDVTFDPANDYLYVADFGSSNVTVINTSTYQVVTQIPLTFGIQTIVTDTATGLVYTANTVSTVYAISPLTNQVASTTSVAPESSPEVQTYDAANGDIYVTDLVSNVVSVIHGAAVVATIPVGVSPNGAAYDSANGEVFVSNEGSTVPANLTVIDGTANQVVGQVYPSGNGPGVAYASSNRDVYTCTNGIQDGFSNLVSVASGTTNQVVTSIPISSACGGDVYDPSNGYVYVTDRDKPGGQDQSNVTLIDPDTNRVVLTQPVQLAPIGIAYDSANHNVYVADSGTDNISILPQIYRLTVHETGLPNGTNWSAMIGGTTFSSTTPSVTFPEPNGTFDFTIGSVVNRSASPFTGTVTVSGGPQELNLTFSNSKGGGLSSGLFGLPGATGYYVLGGFVALLVAAVAVVVVLTRRKRRAKPSPTTPPPDGATGRDR